MNARDPSIRRPIGAVRIVAPNPGQVGLNDFVDVLLELTRELVATDGEDEPGQATDRAYWVAKGSEASVTLADRILQLINEVAPSMALKYNKHYIGLARDGLADNFILFRARKEHLIGEFRIPRLRR